MSGCHPTELKEKSDREIIYDLLTIHADRILRLEEHLGRQIDENRKIIARVDELDGMDKQIDEHHIDENIKVGCPHCGRFFNR